MPSASKIHVRIENPLPGGSEETNLRRAQRFVRAGRAVFTAALVIRFVNGASQAVLAEREDERRTLALTGRAYDQLNGNYYRHARRLPLMHPEKMLVKGARG